MAKYNKLVRRVVDQVWNRGNVDEIDELYSDDVTIYVPGAKFQGKDGFKQFLGMYREAFPDLEVELREVFTDGDAGVNRWRFRGTHKGPMMGLEPTGKSVSIEGMTLARHKKGKIYEEHFLWDRLDQLEQLGLSAEDLDKVSL